MPSFSNKKELRFVITLATGTFGSRSNNVITLEGFRATVDTDKAGGMMMGTLHAQICGVNQGDMNSMLSVSIANVRDGPDDRYPGIRKMAGAIGRREG